MGLTYTFVDNFTTIQTVAGATENETVPKLSYNKFGNLPELTNGLNLRRIVNDQIEFSGVTKNNYNLLRQPTTNIETFISDGTNSLLKIRSQFIAPVRLHSKHNDRIEIFVNDDLSGMLEFNITAEARKVVLNGI